MGPSGSTPEEKPASEPQARANGIDVSYFDNSIDWEMVRKAGMTPPGSRRVARNGKGTTHHNTLAVHGVDFAYIRATDPALKKGRHGVIVNSIDPKFHTFWHDARQAGVIRGAYHLFRPQHTVARQVEQFVNTVGALEADDLPPMFDLEKTGGQTSEVIIERSHEWLQAVEQHYGRKPVIYTSPSFWNEHMSGQHHESSHHHTGRHHHAKPLVAGQDERHSKGHEQGRPLPQDLFSQYPLFIANYGRSHPQLPRSTWKAWTFWQYTETGSVHGVHAKEVDCDVFNGTVAQLKDFVKQSIVGVDKGGSGQASTPAQSTQAEKPAPTADQQPTPEKAPATQTAPDTTGRKPQEPAPPSTGPADASHTYTVRSGDTLDGLVHD